MQVVLEDGVFYWEKGEKRTCLLNCNDFLSNKSCIPMHSIDGQSRTVFDIIGKLLNKGIEQGLGEEIIHQRLLIDVLLIRQLISTSKPLKVLEIGCKDGSLSYHLASIMGEFHKESILYCMSDQMEIEWLGRMEEVEELPHLSFLATDYEEALLEKEAFDIILLNGEIQTKKEYQVLERTLSFLKEEGSLIVYSNETPLLESTFQLLFKEREEYRFSPQKVILVGEKSERDWCRNEEDIVEEEMQFIQQVELELEKNNFDSLCWEKLLKKVEAIIDKEMQANNTKQKQWWISIKEKMLDYWLSYHKEEKKMFEEEIKELIKISKNY